MVDNEELVVALRPHPIALARAVIVTLLVLVGWLALLGHLPTSPRPLHQLLFWILWVGGGGALIVWPVRDTIRFLTSYFVVTSDRVIHRSGWIAKRSMEIPLEAINDVRFSQNVFERMINSGDVIISSASEQGREAFQDIRNPEEVQKTIYHQGELNQQRMMSGAGPAQAPAASAADELKKLDDLRASGVISEEEFRDQKRKLLGS